MATKTQRKKELKLELADAPDNRAVVLIIEVALLALIGTFAAITYFGHFIYFNSDFSSFLGEGQVWLSGQIPANMKRAPLFSILTALLGHVFTGPARYLVGTEILNAVLLPAVMILVYLVARPTLGRAAVWTALLAGISPWMIWCSSQPLAEIFCTAMFAAFVYCILLNSRWAYLFAMILSITRWDFAAALPTAAVIDIIRNRKWARTIAISALASIPFMLCMLITFAQAQIDKAGSGYLQVMAKDHQFKLLLDMDLYWKVICSFLSAPILPIESTADTNTTVKGLSAIFLAVSFVLGAVFAFTRRRWELIAGLGVLVPYAALHSVFPFHFERFVLPMAWLVMIISVLSLLWAWNKLKASGIPELLTGLISLGGAALFAFWAISLWDTLKAFTQFCPPVFKTAIVIGLIILIGLVVLLIIRRLQFGTGLICLAAFLALATVSNCANIAPVMGDGTWQANFRDLGLWFVQNAGPEDKMVTTMPGHMPVYTGFEQSRFVHMVNVPSDSNDLESFIVACRKQGITIIAWDSRLAGNPNDLYYKLWGLKRIEPLAAPFIKPEITRIGPCVLLKTFEQGTPKIAVWRIRSE